MVKYVWLRYIFTKITSVGTLTNNFSTNGTTNLLLATLLLAKISVFDYQPGKSVS